jgi:hypothetical protein
VVENSKKHLLLASAQPDLIELHKLQRLEKHLTRCADARRSGDWKSILRETDSAITAGAESSSLVSLYIYWLKWVTYWEQKDVQIHICTIFFYFNINNSSRQ